MIIKVQIVRDNGSVIDEILVNPLGPSSTWSRRVIDGNVLLDGIRVTPIAFTIPKPPEDQDYDFTLTLRGAHAFPGEVSDALYRFGCDDATMTYRGCVMYVAFTRKAKSLDAAVAQAMRQVQDAGFSIASIAFDG